MRSWLASLRRPLTRTCYFRKGHIRPYGSKGEHKEVIFSGIQPTGLGNYFGALSQWVEMQHMGTKPRQLLYSIVGLHALTMPQNPKKLLEDRLNTLASLLAIGSTTFRISVAPELSYHDGKIETDDHLEGSTSSIVSFAQITRGIQSKLAIQQDISNFDVDDSNLNLGLFTYPVLQAADVLLYRTTHVPVGEDQRQHLELARELAHKMNRLLKHEFFPLPIAIISKSHSLLLKRFSGLDYNLESTESPDLSPKT
ncbi:13643_t:CDS:2 [Acaulospora colombiana]|uniref:13643_t:CDS:1 n=1 Tax=Acaulospora colombiana TaxID=27376 RepID=A0ACA9P3B2_9GLOM|nr:13643_t:CDS:2 [Acaulospora colombiana]